MRSIGNVLRSLNLILSWPAERLEEPFYRSVRLSKFDDDTTESDKGLDVLRTLVLRGTEGTVNLSRRPVQYEMRLEHLMIFPLARDLNRVCWDCAASSSSAGRLRHECVCKTVVSAALLYGRFFVPKRA